MKNRYSLKCNNKHQIDYKTFAFTRHYCEILEKCCKKFCQYSMLVLARLSLVLFVSFSYYKWFSICNYVTGLENIPLGQHVLPLRMEQPRQRIQNILGGFYSHNVTLYFRNSPYRVQSELIVESDATLTIETGVQIYFDSGVGIKVFGIIQAIVCHLNLKL